MARKRNIPSTVPESTVYENFVEQTEHQLDKAPPPPRNANISAKQALDWGIANQMIADDGLEQAVLQAANRLANGPSIAIACVKSNLQEASKGDLSHALDTEAANQGKCFKSKDFIEGVTAFMEKRKVVFQGK